ncbi:MAG: NADH:ubiquinone reductase (Na(+)-transporting) subunit A, partial [Betaproteobacteria bacterium]
MSVHRISRGLDIPLAGAPAQDAVHNAPATASVGWVAADFPGLKAAVLVAVGDRVRRGTPLVEDKVNPGVRHMAAAGGTVAAIHRGERRRLESIVIVVDAAADSLPPPALANASRTAFDAAGARALLLESGLWTALRTRPYSKVPAADASPHALFVTAIDTRPHAPDVDAVVAARLADFHAGLALVATLCPGTTYVCVAADSRIEVPALERVAVERFAGPHPAGTAGLHIGVLDPVGGGRTAWHVG